MGARRQGRILAFQALYAWSAAGSRHRQAALGDLLEFSWIDESAKKSLGEAPIFPVFLFRVRWKK